MVKGCKLRAYNSTFDFFICMKIFLKIELIVNRSYFLFFKKTPGVSGSFRLAFLCGKHQLVQSSKTNFRRAVSAPACHGFHLFHFTHIC